MLLLNLNKKSEIDLISLGINLALNKKNAQMMCDNNRLRNLIDRAFKYQDSLMLKMIRNISSHDILRRYFIVSSIITIILLHLCNEDCLISRIS